MTEPTNLLGLSLSAFPQLHVRSNSFILSVKKNFSLVRKRRQMMNAMNILDKKWNDFVSIKGGQKVQLFRLPCLPTTYPKEIRWQEEMKGWACLKHTPRQLDHIFTSSSPTHSVFTSRINSSLMSPASPCHLEIYGNWRSKKRRDTFSLWEVAKLGFPMYRSVTAI